MKLLLVHAVAIVIALSITGCGSDSSSSVGPTKDGYELFGKKPGPVDTTPPPPPPSANPAFVFSQSTWVPLGRVKGKETGYYAFPITTLDADGTDRTPVYYPPTNTPTRPVSFSATWSPDGNKVSFVEGEQPGWFGLFTIATLDISVVNGVATATNKQVVLGVDAADSMTISAQAFCPDGAKIAFVANTPQDYAVYTIPVNGGVPTKVYWVPVNAGSISGTIAWDRSGTRLAIVEVTQAGVGIKIISMDGTVVTGLAEGQFQIIESLDWSNAGPEFLAFSARVAGYSNNVYSINTAPGSTPLALAFGGEKTVNNDGTLYIWSDMRDIRISPDGQKVIYARWAKSGPGMSSYLTNDETDFEMDLGTMQSTNLFRRGHGDWK